MARGGVSFLEFNNNTNNNNNNNLNYFYRSHSSNSNKKSNNNNNNNNNNNIFLGGIGGIGRRFGRSGIGRRRGMGRDDDFGFVASSSSSSSFFITTTTRTNKTLFIPNVPRGGDFISTTTTNSQQQPITTITTNNNNNNILFQSLYGLYQFVQGKRMDALILFCTLALNASICHHSIPISPILGYLFFGLFWGPNGTNMISDVHTIEQLADVGIVLFLFEMGIHLDFKTLQQMKLYVLNIGLCSFIVTTIIMSTLVMFFLLVMMKQSASSISSVIPPAIIIGWSLSLSSSAFVLQLLKDKKQMDTEYGKSAFGTLLLQDLMVVPLLVMTPLLAGGGNGEEAASLGKALTKAVSNILLSLLIIGSFGKILFNPLLSMVTADETKGGSKESLTGLILAIVLGMSFLTQGLGLSNTLGAFLSGMLIAEEAKQYKHIVEMEVAPLRAILIGLFFFTVGFEMDLKLLTNKSTFPWVLGATVGIIILKTCITTIICCIMNVPLITSQRVGMVLSQGGEFAFVAFKTARLMNILNDEQTKFLLTTVSFTMALTPFMESFGTWIANRMEQQQQQAQQQNNVEIQQQEEQQKFITDTDIADTSTFTTTPTTTTTKFESSHHQQTIDNFHGESKKNVGSGLGGGVPRQLSKEEIIQNQKDLTLMFNNNGRRRRPMMEEEDVLKQQQQQIHHHDPKEEEFIAEESVQQQQEQQQQEQQEQNINPQHHESKKEL